jgi:hypothetical protein
MSDSNNASDSMSNHYPFETGRETTTPTTVRTKVASDTYLEIFKKRIGLDQLQAPTTESRRDLLNLLREYVYENQLAIVWYEQKRKKEEARRNKFRRFSIGLLACLPLAVAAVPIVVRVIDKDVSGAEVTALVTAVLTGLLGVQKAVGTWMDQREVIGIFWQASADLKENVYTLEGNWEDRSLEPENPNPQFLVDLEVGIALARKIARTERDAYFATFKAPSLDVGAVLNSARTAASGLWSEFAAGTVAQEQQRLTQVASSQESLTAKRLKVRNLQAEVEKIKKLIGDVPADDPAAKKEYQKRRAKLQIELATAEASAGS